jgi:hypothetical protein
VGHDFLKRRHVDERQDDKGPGKLLRVDLADQFLERDDGCVLSTVRARKEGKHRSCFRAMSNGDRDRECRIASRRHVDRARRYLSPRCLDVADREHILVAGASLRQRRRDDDEREANSEKSAPHAALPQPLNL